MPNQKYTKIVELEKYMFQVAVKRDVTFTEVTLELAKYVGVSRASVYNWYKSYCAPTPPNKVLEYLNEQLPDANIKVGDLIHY